MLKAETKASAAAEWNDAGRERKASCEGGTPAGGGQSKVIRSASRTKRLL